MPLCNSYDGLYLFWYQLYFNMGLKQFFKDLSASPTVLPYLVEIKDSHVLNGQADDSDLGKLDPGQHYFTVKVNEMFLSQQRQWFIKIEPMVICLTSYQYGSAEIDNPFIVGTNLLNSKIQNVPPGMVFRDTRVAGIHPFSGGRFVLGIVLCQSQSGNLLKDAIGFIEKVSGLLSENIKALVGSYAAIATTIIGGIDNLLNSKQIEPLFGFRKEFDADSKEGFSGGYYLMIDKSAKGIDFEKFFVKNNRLCYGQDIDSASPYVDVQNLAKSEYVLFSITKSDTRSDFKTLPVYQSYNKILEELKGTSEVSTDHKEKIKGKLRVLNIEMRQSPDLTEKDAKSLMEKFVKEVSELIDPKYNFGLAPVLAEDDWSRLDKSIANL